MSVIGESKAEKRACRDYRAEHYVRGSSSEFRFGFIGQRAEKRKHKQRYYIIERHYNARKRLIKTEFVDEHHGNDTVVRLPERAYQKECESDENSLFIVEFHHFSFGVIFLCL